MSNLAVDIQELDFSYEQLPVLEHVSLQIDDGEFIGLVGPNGGGKSTLIRIILGLLQPSGGSIEVLGTAPRRARRKIGYVPQYPAFERDFPITVEQVVLMGRLKGAWGGYDTYDREIAQQAMLETEVARLKGRTIGSLSGGQLQRVLVARALASEPRMLLLDEPTSNIDQRVESEIFDLLKQLNERMTLIVVSHDIAFISAYVKRVACLSGTLVCHTTDAISGDDIRALYGEDVRHVHHQH
ncbi:MAG: metal ABC transporter ATP-binding protein [Pseudomonadota bacterium]